MRLAEADPDSLVNVFLVANLMKSLFRRRSSEDIKGQGKSMVEDSKISCPEDDQDVVTRDDDGTSNAADSSAVAEWRDSRTENRDCKELNRWDQKMTKQ